MNDGGPAFGPDAGWPDDNPKLRGLSIRDCFAAAALTGYLMNNSYDEQEASAIAKFSYEAADAMLKARSK